MRIVDLFTLHYYLLLQFADVAELADALVSGSSEAIHVGSSPVVRTMREHPRFFGVFLHCMGAGFEVGAVVNESPVDSQSRE